MREKEIGISGYCVKLIAVLTMTLDHLPVYLNNCAFIANYSVLFRKIGRISAPLFLYMFCESMRHTKDKERFCLRLYYANLFTGFVRFFFDLFVPQFGMIGLQNIFPTYMYTAILILLIEKAKGEKQCLLNYSKSVFTLLVIVFLPPFITDFTSNFRLFHNIFSSQDTFSLSPYYQLVKVIFPSILRVDYSVGFIFLGMLWYFSKTKQTRLIIFFIFSMAVKYISHMDQSSMWPFLDLLGDSTQYLMVFAVPVLLLYDGTRGRDQRWFFYLYYPFHIYVIQTINFLVA